MAYDFSGKYLIVINRDKTFADRTAALVFHDNIGEVMDSIRKPSSSQILVWYCFSPEGSRIMRISPS